MLTITHTHQDGTRVTGTTPADGTSPLLRGHGLRWRPSAAAWHLPGTVDHFAAAHTIEALTVALTAAGHRVQVRVDDTPRPTATVEAEREARATARAAKLARRAARLRAKAERDAQRAAAAHQALPPVAEPIKTDHHSAPRHRAALRTAAKTLTAAAQSALDADDAARAADVAAAATDTRNHPVTVAARIDERAAAARRLARELDKLRATAPAAAPGAADARAAAIERTQHMLDAARAAADYWTEVRAAQLAAGVTPGYSRDTIKAGDEIQVGQRWWTVARANAKTVAVQTAPGTKSTVPYFAISDHRPQP